MSTPLRLALVCVFALAMFASPATSPALSAPTHQEVDFDQVMAFRLEMRKLWMEHGMWMRQDMLSRLAGTGDVQEVSARLARNTQETSDMFGAFYQPADGERLSGLLHRHHTLYAEVVGAARDGDASRLERSSASYADNGRSIAAFFTSLNNETWPTHGVEPLLAHHTEQTLAQLMARQQRNWAADVEAFDTAMLQALELSDALATGLILQFPEKFGATPESGSGPLVPGELLPPPLEL